VYRRAKKISGAGRFSAGTASHRKRRKRTGKEWPFRGRNGGNQNRRGGHGAKITRPSSRDRNKPGGGSSYMECDEKKGPSKKRAEIKESRMAGKMGR